MKLVNAIGGGFLFMGLLWGALSGDIILMLIPSACGVLCFISAILYARKLEKMEEGWRAQYPPYRY